MFFKNFITLFFLALVFTAQTFAQSEENRSLASFDELNVSSAFQVYLTQGTSEKVTVKAKSEHIGRIITEVKNGTLHIYEEDKNKRKSQNSSTAEIYLSFKSLKSIDISGASQIKAKSTLNFEDLEINASGASGIMLEINANDLDCRVNGASKVSLGGQAGDLMLDSSGASRFSASSLVVQNVKVDATGAAKVNVNLTGDLKAKAAGAASVGYKGQPSNVDTDASGAGVVRKM